MDELLNLEQLPSQDSNLPWDGLSYYQRSICSILNSVLDSYGNIFLKEEQKLIQTITSLGNDPQRLFLRLYLRKVGWFRSDKIEYKDVADKNTAIAELVTLGLFVNRPTDVEEVLECLQMEEMKLVAKEMDVKCTGKNREQLKEDILNTRKSNQKRLNFFATSRKSIAEESGEKIMEASRKFIGELIRIPVLHVENLKRIIGLFFLNSSTSEESNLSTAILTGLNRKKYANYSIVRSRPIFETRDDWIAYDEACNYEQTLQELLSTDESITLDFVMDMVTSVQENWQRHFQSGEKVESYFLRRFTAGWVYTRILSWFIGILEKSKAHLEANRILESLLSQDVYCVGQRGRWWERLMVNQTRHLDQKDEAIKTCRNALADEHVRTGSRLSLQRRLCKLTQTPFTLDTPPETVTIYADPEDKRTVGRKLCYQLPGQILGTVEDLVLSQYEGQGWQGFHCESSIYLMLFTLCFWDILFNSLEFSDVFQTPYQTAPLDLRTDAFYAQRYPQITLRLDSIKNGMAPQLIKDAYTANTGCTAVGVQWEKYSLTDVLDISDALGGVVLATIFKVLAEDHANSSSGLPDLLLYKPDGSEYLLVEVKSSNDRLSDGQRNWNALFKQNNIKHIVCRVLDTSEQDKDLMPSRKKRSKTHIDSDFD